MKIGHSRKSCDQFLKALDDVDSDRPTYKEEKLEGERFQYEEQKNAHDDETKFIHRHPPNPEGL
ncbi:MAG: hypothetical protein K2Y18_03560 [Alphaproteobacteria bacterium]|jgi:hypothetical protein|nr:hypothetical protein [Alphaproteobacteria bacterium]